MDRCWQPTTFTTLHQGVDAVGRKLPSTAAAVAQRMGWIPQLPDGVYVPSRIVRLAQANVVPVLKALAHWDRLIPHVAGALDEHGDLDTSRLGEQCRDVSAAFVRNLARQLRRAGADHVSSITQLQSVPAVPRLARLGAVDARLAALDVVDPAGVWLRIKLPITVAPAGRADWRWYKLWCPISPHLKGRDIRIWHLPTISLHQNIAKRVLLAKNRVKRPRHKAKRIATVAHQPVTKTRQKTTATPKQRRHKRTRHTAPRATTTNQTHPARQASVWVRDQPTAPVEGTSAQPISDTSDTSGSASNRDR
jgi:hypothetical protein